MGGRSRPATRRIVRRLGGRAARRRRRVERKRNRELGCDDVAGHPIADAGAYSSGDQQAEVSSEITLAALGEHLAAINHSQSTDLIVALAGGGGPRALQTRSRLHRHRRTAVLSPGTLREAVGSAAESRLRFR
jgi:hypothetical protein